MNGKRVSGLPEGLAERLANMEPQAYQEFAGHFGPRFRSLFLGKGMPAAEAEDLAASCITDILLKIKQYRVFPGVGFAAWVFVLARHALADWYRAKRPKRRGARMGVAVPVGAGKPVTDTQAVVAVQQALGRLPLSLRRVVELRDLGPGMSYEEIGAHLGIKDGTARVRHHRAVRQLTAFLEADPRIEKDQSQMRPDTTEKES